MNRRDLLKSAFAAPLTTAATLSPLAIPASAQIGTTVSGIEVFRVRVNDRGNWVIVRVKTTQGLLGIGDASHSGNDDMVIELLKEFSDRFKGNSPFQIEAVRSALSDDIARTGRPGVVAFSALEQAYYDIQGRALGVPCFALFGGMIHERIPHYANINRATVNRTPEGFIEQAELAVKAGFQAIKIAPFDGMPRGNPEKAEAHTKRGIECVAAVRKAIGPKRRLLVDAQSNFDVTKGLELAMSLEPYELGWLEEATDSIAGMAEINQAAKMPTAGGQAIWGVRGFFPFIAGKAVDIVMPDVKYCGGMLEMKKIGSMAEGAGLFCAPHGPGSPVGNVAAAHVCAGMRNFLTLEIAFNEAPWRAELVDPPQLFTGGSIATPESPGFGIRLNDPVLRKHTI